MKLLSMLPTARRVLLLPKVTPPCGRFCFMTTGMAGKLYRLCDVAEPCRFAFSELSRGGANQHFVALCEAKLMSHTKTPRHEEKANYATVAGIESDVECSRFSCSVDKGLARMVDSAGKCFYFTLRRRNEVVS